MSHDNEEGATRAVFDAFSQHQMEAGTFVAMGAHGVLKMLFPDGWTEEQRDNVFTVFFLGAQHVYTGQQRLFGPGIMTPAKEGLQAEMDRFYEQFQQVKKASAN